MTGRNVNFLHHQTNVLLNQELLPKHCRDRCLSSIDIQEQMCTQENCQATLGFTAHDFVNFLPKLLFGIVEQKIPMSCCMAPFFSLQTLVFIACSGLFLFVHLMNSISLFSTFSISPFPISHSGIKEQKPI